jgi:hypothetical protein
MRAAQPATATAPPDRTVLLIIVSAVALPIMWACVTFLRAPAVGVFHDDGVYLVTAKALATGNGYRIVSLPGSPAQTKYPILFPFLLSLVWRAAPEFPRNLIWLRLIPLCAGACWLALSWRLLRRLGATSEVAAISVALAAASPWTIFLSTTLLSETLFAAWLAAALLALVRTGEQESGRFSAIAAGGLMGAAILTRTPGVAPAFGGAVFLVLNRRWKPSVQYAAAASLLAVPWFLWSNLHAADTVVDPFYSGDNYRSWNIVFNYPWRDKLAVIGVNAFWATQVGEYWGLGLRTWSAWSAAIVCSVWTIRGFWLRRRSAVTLVCLCYFALVLAWAFPPMRFIVPIIPCLVWLMFTGAGRLRPVAFVVASLLMLSSLAATARVAHVSAARGGTWFDEYQVDDWRGIANLIAWVDQNTPHNATLIATHDPTFYLFTGRQAVRPDSMDPLMLYYNVWGRAADAEREAEAFRERVLLVQADYVVVTPRDTMARIDRLDSRFPGSFTIVEGSRASRHAIYQIDRGKLVAN